MATLVCDEFVASDVVTVQFKWRSNGRWIHEFEP